MKSARWILAFVLALLVGTAGAQDKGPSAPTIDPHKAAVIQELLDVTGFTALASQIMDTMLDGQRKANRISIRRSGTACATR
jgi:hypothetical protein